MLSARICIGALLGAALLGSAAAQPTFGVPLSSAQKPRFLAAILGTPQLQIEAELPHKLAPLHAFKPYFSMYELASTAYALVLESPHDMLRWRALARIDAWADGEYAFGYDSARRKALAHNPRLFDACPEFHRWANKARHGENI